MTVASCFRMCIYTSDRYIVVIAILYAGDSLCNKIASLSRFVGEQVYFFHARAKDADDKMQLYVPVTLLFNCTLSKRNHTRSILLLSFVATRKIIEALRANRPSTMSADSL